MSTLNAFNFEEVEESIEFMEDEGGLANGAPTSQHGMTRHTRSHYDLHSKKAGHAAGQAVASVGASYGESVTRAESAALLRAVDGHAVYRHADDAEGHWLGHRGARGGPDERPTGQHDRELRQHGGQLRVWRPLWKWE